MYSANAKQIYLMKEISESWVYLDIEDSTNFPRLECFLMTLHAMMKLLKFKNWFPTLVEHVFLAFPEQPCSKERKQLGKNQTVLSQSLVSGSLVSLRV